MAGTKAFTIEKKEIWEAFQHVNANQGAAGVDGQTLESFGERLGPNFYKLWNRMSSGSYMPSPVRRGMIPKADGGQRPLGIPTVTDRIAQEVVRLYLEPLVEPIFHRDSYGYRPERSAIDAIRTARQRCWRYDWVLDMDIKGFFDTIDHELLLKAVRHHTDCRWVLLYIERWLKAPVMIEDGSLVPQERGAPQGGVVSPLLANLFLHYALLASMGCSVQSKPQNRLAWSTCAASSLMSSNATDRPSPRKPSSASPSSMPSKKRRVTSRLETASPCARAKPIFNDLETWLQNQLPKISGKTSLAEAIRYALSRMPKARGYLENGQIEADNNICERSIRPLTLGRKSHLFMGSEGSGHRLHLHRNRPHEQGRSRGLADLGPHPHRRPQN